MASSENQGLQITLTIFILLSIVMMVTAFMFFRNWDEARDRATADASARQKAEADLRKATEEIDQMREMIGSGAAAAAGPTPEGGTPAAAGIEALQQNFDGDMQKFAATLPEDKRRYRDALEALSDELATVNQRLKEELDRTKDLMEKHEAREKAKDQQIQEHVAAVQAAKADLAGERAKFAQQLQEITAINEELKSKLSERLAEIEQVKAQSDADQKRMTSEITTLNTRIADLQFKIANLTRTTFEVADGEVVRANLAKKTVWINLGSDDYVRPQLTFSVYGQDPNDVARYDSKGSIEVVQVIGPKLAEARILDDQLADPIAPGDKIYTPAWAPGRQEHFALSGMLDIDGDGVSDRQAIRDLITMAGGVIDAELDDDGQKIGELSLQTRYLVQGDTPAGDFVKAFNDMTIEAGKYGVEVITLEKFLDHVGWRDPQRRLDYRSGRGSDFRIPRSGTPPISGGNVTDLFRQRRPPVPSGGSAFPN